LDNKVTEKNICSASLEIRRALFYNVYMGLLFDHVVSQMNSIHIPPYILK